MGQLIDGKAIAKKIEDQTAKRVALLKDKGIGVSLAVVLVGEDPPSQTYARRKGQAAQRAGIEFQLIKLPGDIGKQKLIDEVKKIQEQKKLSGLIVQLPLPEPLYTAKVLNAISPQLDVDW